jgi:hypothetical protein
VHSFLFKFFVALFRRACSAFALRAAYLRRFLPFVIPNPAAGEGSPDCNVRFLASLGMTAKNSTAVYTGEPLTLIARRNFTSCL